MKSFIFSLLSLPIIGCVSVRTEYLPHPKATAPENESQSVQGLMPLQDIFMRRHVRQEGLDIQNGKLAAIAVKTDTALDRIVQRAVLMLSQNGQAALAVQKKSEWDAHFSGYLSASMPIGPLGDIGDHKPLVQWLANFYDIVEKTLGVDMCKKTHLSDIKTLNFTIPVVFHPCTFSMDAVTIDREHEYRKHFDEGDVYYGLVPVVTYWTADIACSVASQGGGAVWLCGPISGAAEFFMAKTVAYRLSDFVYEHACGQ